MLKKSSGLLKLLLLLGAISVLYPFESTVVPPWKLRVVDETGTPAVGLRVKQYWQNYLVESEDHLEEAATDANGYVSFPHRTVRASLLRRTIGPILNVIKQGIHASFGPSAQIIVLHGHASLGDDATWQPGKPLPESIVLQ